MLKIQLHFILFNEWLMGACCATVWHFQYEDDKIDTFVAPSLLQLIGLQPLECRFIPASSTPGLAAIRARLFLL